jgi:hypothetical protein
MQRMPSADDQGQFRRSRWGRTESALHKVTFVAMVLSLLAIALFVGYVILMVVIHRDSMP